MSRPLTAAPNEHRTPPPARRSAARAHLLAALLALGALNSAAGAQYLTRPQLPWQTVETAHFAFYFPAEMREWTVSLARRMEAVAASVNAVAGNAPVSRVTVMVEDPSNVANGFAVPLLGGPVIFLWPTPPTPTPTFGAYAGWGEALAVHEYGHIAHLTIPSRNPNERLLWKFLPARVGPVARKSPNWVIEGYATVIEGQLTGNGRPNSAGRAAVLRQWALEGKLPTYGQLDNGGTFFGGNMRYLAGSAFLEWLESRKGDSSLVHLWRRMSARQQRAFAPAFAGVFGAPPEDLYGKFFVELTAASLEIQRRLVAAGLVEGELVQKLNWGTGDPAVSPDGKQVAVVVRSAQAPSRLVVWRTATESSDSAVKQQRQRLLQRDPLDVPAIDSFPPPKRAVATLRAFAGRSHEMPRWLPDGVHVLVTRDEPLSDGAIRPDLFLWNSRSGGLRRVTRGAAIRSGDPSPDGKSAAAVRCVDGICSLVVVDLASGSWRVLAAGSPDIVWHRPRWSPDGARIAASYHAAGRWSVAIVDARTGDARTLSPADGAQRFSPAWADAGRELVVVSERGGIANLERMNIDGASVKTLTRVTGAEMAPDVSRAEGRVYFLALHAKGYDLRRIALDSATTAPNVVAIPADLAPAAPRRATLGAPTFAAQASPPVHEYGLGPRRWRVLPGVVFDADGAVSTLMVGNIDPIARLSVLAQGGLGDRGAWRGGSLSATLRRRRVDLQGSLFYVDRRPSRQKRAPFAPMNTDGYYSGLGGLASFSRERSVLGLAGRAGASAGKVTGSQLAGVGRIFGFGDGHARLTLSTGSAVLSAQGGLQYAVGTTDGESWTRQLISGGFVAGTRVLAVRGQALRGTVTAAGDADFGRSYEQFIVGGAAVPYFDRAFVSQFIPLSGVPAGYAYGRKVGVYRLSLDGFAYEPFAEWVAAGDSLAEWKRLVGVEQSFDFPALGFARLPQVRVRFGGAYALDEPYRRKARAYFSLTYSP